MTSNGHLKICNGIDCLSNPLPTCPFSPTGIRRRSTVSLPVVDQWRAVPRFVQPRLPSRPLGALGAFSDMRRLSLRWTLTRGSHGRGRADGDSRRCASTLVATAVIALGVLAHAGSAAASAGLAFDGCIGNLSNGSGCAATNPVEALDRAVAVALSPNGTRLYVAAEDLGVLSQFTLDAAGNPSFAGCAGKLTGCAATSPAGATELADGMAISPDGMQLYVTWS